MSHLNGGLNLDPSDPLYILITSYPDYNSEGNVAKDNIVGFLKAQLKGIYTQLVCDDIREGRVVSDPYALIFFKQTVYFDLPKFAYVVKEETGISDGSYWDKFSKALLCHSMYDNCSHIKKLNIDKINSDITSSNKRLKDEGIFKFYTYIIKDHYIKEVLSYTGDFTEAKNAYIANICTQDWVNYKMLLYNAGQWTDGEWEEFHHWIKLKALGASDDEITSTVKDLRDMGLNIWDRVDENNWKNYKDYSVDISQDDVNGEARGPVTQRVQKYKKNWLNECIPYGATFEGFSKAFIDDQATEYIA